MKRAQRHMKIKEMAKKTRVATTTSEEDAKTDTGKGDCSIRIITVANHAHYCNPSYTNT